VSFFLTDHSVREMNGEAVPQKATDRSALSADPLTTGMSSEPGGGDTTPTHRCAMCARSSQFTIHHSPFPFVLFALFVVMNVFPEACQHGALCRPTQLNVLPPSRARRR